MKISGALIPRDRVISKMRLSKIKEKLPSIQKYGEARKVIEKAGLTNADEILAYLGFKVQWKELDPNEARIALL